MGFGYSLFFYAGSVFSTPLVAEYRWSKAQFALLGTILIINVVCLPVIGRLTDIFGVRRVVLCGIIAGPAVFIGLSTIGGSIGVFLALNYLLAIVHGATTSSTVFGRLLAQRFEKARPRPVDHGRDPRHRGRHRRTAAHLADGGPWLALGLVSGIVTLMLIPRDYDSDRAATHRLGDGRLSRDPADADLPDHPGGAAVLQSGDDGLPVADQADPGRPQSLGVATTMVSVYVTGMLFGRLGCGLALDRFPAHIVPGICMAQPLLRGAFTERMT